MRYSILSDGDIPSSRIKSNKDYHRFRNDELRHNISPDNPLNISSNKNDLILSLEEERSYE